MEQRGAGDSIADGASEAYVLRSGAAAAERLALLDELCWPTTAPLLEDRGLTQGTACLDVGCGTGRVTMRMSAIAGPGARCLGVDADADAIEIARREANDRGSGAEFAVADAGALGFDAEFDLVYLRFLVGHCPDPGKVVAAAAHATRPGGCVVVEDVHFPGHFCAPPSPAFDRYVELYQAAARARGADPTIGVRLPALLREGGLADVGFDAVVPTFDREPGLRFAAITLDATRPAIVASGLASDGEVRAVVDELEALARAPGTVMSITRICRSWGTRRA